MIPTLAISSEILCDGSAAASTLFHQEEAQPENGRLCGLPRERDHIWDPLFRRDTLSPLFFFVKTPPREGISGLVLFASCLRGIGVFSFRRASNYSLPASRYAGVNVLVYPAIFVALLFALDTLASLDPLGKAERESFRQWNPCLRWGGGLNEFPFPP